MNKRDVGQRYEELATDYLIDKGYRILDRNYRDHRFGEIDIVALRKETVVFIEIKYRSSDAFGDPAQCVDFRKRKKICKTALHYLTINGYGTEAACRFDVICIYGDGRIRHIENAFEYC